MILSFRAVVFPSQIFAIPIGIKYLKASIDNTTDQNNNKNCKTVIIKLKIGSVIELITHKNIFFVVLVIELLMYSKSASEFELVIEVKNLRTY